mmetsp:Transcript_97407/g.313844  ORF Transcript_97407/g.313844 Transcript_97407/m.313844 type:complete len:93 (+) Transcript_97407:1276-1554(+)
MRPDLCVGSNALGVSPPAGSELDSDEVGSDVGSDAADSDDPEALGGDVGAGANSVAGMTTPTGLTVESGGRAAVAIGEWPKPDAMAARWQRF